MLLTLLSISGGASPFPSDASHKDSKTAREEHGMEGRQRKGRRAGSFEVKRYAKGQRYACKSSSEAI